jgi:NADH dehydrogenase FAD-containing subunit
VVSFNTGSSIPVDHGAIEDEDNIFTVKPIVNLTKARHTILNLIQNSKPRILVVGGGPASVEISGNTWRLVYSQGGESQITILVGVL